MLRADAIIRGDYRSDAGGTGLKHLKTFPDRFDVGIAEEHAITMAAGWPGWRTSIFCGVSTFLQRGYDQLIHDVCAKLGVTLCIDRAGLGRTATPSGVFDIAIATCPI
ncbi:MAG: hypothetical protein ACLUVV_04190 [Christensenellales bacterium]